MGGPSVELIELSRKYGSDPAWVLAGGGNTSCKDASTLWVKASGTSLATIGSDGFCALDRAALDAVWSRDYPAADDAREAAALADLMGARLPGETKRPSVEALLHGFFPQRYVVHTHPSLVNGMTCGAGGEAAFRELFADEAIWVPLVDPGYVLARAVRSGAEAFRARTGGFPAVVFMQNHGLLVAAETPAEIVAVSARVVARLRERVGREPDRSPRAVPARALAAAAAGIAAAAPAGSLVLQRADADILRLAADTASWQPLSSAFSPDHIVYAGHEFLRAAAAGEIGPAWSAYRAHNGVDPRIVVAPDAGAFAVAGSAAASETAMALFLDACAVAVYAGSFGGALHMPREKIDFIRNWEVERYRARTSLGDGKDA